MYNLLLVDDEKTILDGLAYNIAWEETGFTGVYKAYTAKEALEILEKNRIDVVVSDISMPEMDGIEMCRRVRENWPMSKIIFLSGHRDFEYARQAVELNVYQYLVKPVAYEDLQQTIAGALAELQTDLEQRNLISAAREKMRTMEMLLRERLLAGWLVNGESGLDRYRQELSDVGLPLESGMAGFTLLIEANGAPGETGNAMLQMGLHTLAESMFSGYRHLFCLPVKRDVLLIVFLCDEGQSARHLRMQYKNRLDAFQLSARSSLGCVLSLAMGRVMEIDALHTAYGELRDALDLERFGEQGQILLVDAPTENEGLHMRRELREAVAAADSNAFARWVVKTCAGARASDRQRDICELIALEVRGVLTRDAMARGIHGEALRQCCAPLFEREPNDPDEIEAACLDAADTYIGLVRQTQEARRRRLVDAVRAMVEANLQEGLSVNAIAERMHYNPSYLSRLIKQETGQTLVDLIITIRMDEACRLLKAGNRVQDVAQAVGYDNLAHFSRIFKKKIGVSPRQYA